MKRFKPLNEMTTFEQHHDEIKRLEADRLSYHGDWFSGKETPMKVTVKHRITLIWKRIDRLFKTEDD